MTLFTGAFYYMAGASVASALLAVTRRSPVHSMLWVLALFLHVAGIFLLLGAEFLAAVQVIVYAGAILIFYLFVVMLLDLPSEAAPLFERLRSWRAATARELGAPAYIVFGDATLRGIALTEPSSLGELGEISGVGAKKLEQYGEAVLAIVRGEEPPALPDGAGAASEDSGAPSSGPADRSRGASGARAGVRGGASRSGPPVAAAEPPPFFDEPPPEDEPPPPDDW